MEHIKSELLACKQKIKALAITDYSKLLPITKTTLLKNHVLWLQEAQERGEFEVDRERNEIFQQMTNMRQDVHALKAKLKLNDKSNIHIQQVHQMSANIDESVMRFKEKMSELFDQIADEEEQLSHDIQLIEDKMNVYESAPVAQQRPPLNPTNVNEAKPKMAETSKSNANTGNAIDEIKSRIERIDERIKLNGGKNIGWEDEEHQEFLRLRTKHQGRITAPQFFVDCVKSIPLHTEDEIKDHIERFQKYLDMEDAKKSLVEQYKRAKQEQKDDLIRQAQIEEQVKQEFEAKNKKTKEQLEIERQRQKEQLEKWKMKKVTQKVVESEIQTEQRRELERVNWEKKQQERDQKKYLVEQYREQKKMQELREKESEQFQSMVKRHVSSDAKARIRAREEYMTEKRRSKVELDKIRQVEREMQMEKINEQKACKYAYVEPKLLETTKAAQQHQRDKFNPQVDQGKYADTFGGNLLGNGRRAVPTWRQGAQF